MNTFDKHRKGENMRKIIILMCVMSLLLLTGCNVDYNRDGNKDETSITTTAPDDQTTPKETTTEMPSTTENDGRADYWEDAYLFNLMPYFLDGEFIGYLSSNNVETLGFTGISKEFAVDYIEQIKNNSYFKEPETNMNDTYISFSVHDEVMIYYSVYYDIANESLDISIDSSAVADPYRVD